MSVTNPMAPAEPIKLKIKQKKCEMCGGLYVPTSNRQKYCPDCKKAMKDEAADTLERIKRRAAAARPGEVVTYKVEVPEKKMQKPETPEDPIVPEGIKHGYTDLLRAIDKPDWEAFLDQAHAVLIAYGRGDLVDKNELMAEIREKFKSFLEV